MELNENGKITVSGEFEGDYEYEIEKPRFISTQGWKDFASLLPEKMRRGIVLKLLHDLKENIIDNKDSGKDLIHSLELTIAMKELEIQMIEYLIKSSKL